MEDQKTLKNGNKKRKGRAGRRKAKRRLRILLAFDFVMLIAVAALLVFTVTQTKLVLNGDPEMEITVGSEFNDPGVQSKNAVTSGTVDTSKPGTYTIEYSFSSVPGFDVIALTTGFDVVVPQPPRITVNTAKNRTIRIFFMIIAVCFYSKLLISLLDTATSETPATDIPSSPIAISTATR